MVIYKKLAMSGFILGFFFMAVLSITSICEANTGLENGLLALSGAMGSIGLLIACIGRIRLSIGE